MKKTISLTIFLFFNKFYSQHTEPFTYGLKIGAVHSSVSNLPEMIVGRDNSLTHFSLDSKGSYGVESGFFVNAKLPNTRVALQGEILYRNTGDKLTFNNALGKNYTLSFDYSFITIGAIYKIYPYKGFNAGTGVFYSKNINPSNINYTSNEYEGRYDTTKRQFYRDALLGSDDFSLSFSLGYELPYDLHIEGRYYLGLGDIIKNKTASFQFIENYNRSSIIGLSIGYSLHNW
ncbi:outer membrane beta-barrel protein [Flavobacterium columnare]|uniref:outer membrane beta-barrel protein n=1 Tax=Flavobacterium columnare TaxID=996 RepID=UPI0009815622|nr:outer membrane beta-barrel protein [Flavobacterium columnare]OOB81733.1 hypothetical protein BZL53_13365 [Flavobacterium columnare]OOB82102.1 hypothetical protein BZL53_12080 [Flavobacterium columnare]PTD14799.1 hypothetical protein C6N29_10300 [Flavobacterium columnare]PTD16575.1 hypothetical protein C6N29_02920 [Flavobacterium columnare]